MDKSKNEVPSEIMDRLILLEKEHASLLERVKILESEKLQSSELTAMLRELIHKS